MAENRCARCNDHASEACCHDHPRLICSACKGTDEWLRGHLRAPHTEAGWIARVAPRG